MTGTVIRFVLCLLSPGFTLAAAHKTSVKKKKGILKEKVRVTRRDGVGSDWGLWSKGSGGSQNCSIEGLEIPGRGSGGQQQPMTWSSDVA